MGIDVNTLREERGKLIHDARELADKAAEEKREFTAEEQTQYDKMLGDSDKLRTKIEGEERLLEQERQLEMRKRETGPGKPPAEPDAEQRMLAFSGWLRRAANIDLNDIPEPERRALEATTDSAGGYLIPPQQFVDTLIKAIDDETYIRQWGTGHRLAIAASMGMPYLSADPADADWTTELGTGSEDSTMAFGNRELACHPVAKRIKVSNQLLRQAPNAEALVRDRLAYKFGITAEKAYLTGSGASQPLGLFTASAHGIATTYDVSTGNTTTSMTFDGLMEAKYGLKGGYLANANWLFHRDGVKQIAKLKDGEGQYLWQPSVQMGQPDMILGRPVGMSEYAPNTFTTGLYVGIIGDFRYYHYVDALDLQIQRLVELYAATNQTGFIGRLEGDGMPVLGEAFRRVTLA